MAEKRDPSSHRTPAQIRKMNHGYDARPENVAKRSKTNQARAMMEKEGRVHKGDGKDVGHKTPIRKGGGNSKGNLAVQSRHYNRGWEAGGKNR